MTATARLQLDPPREADLEDLHRIYSDARTWTHLPSGRFADLATTRAALARWLEDWERESWQVSRDFLYPLAFGGKLPCDVKEPQKVVWSNEAIEQAIPVIDERLERAGIRLAEMLDAALG